LHAPIAVESLPFTILWEHEFSVLLGAIYVEGRYEFVPTLYDALAVGSQPFL
jgi:hypothetical protein